MAGLEEKILGSEFRACVSKTFVKGRLKSPNTAS